MENQKLPAGLIEGQKLSELFSELSWRQAGVDDFKDFPYPFVCIGTDILMGEMVEMNSGDLSSAMRASMAIPSVFTAVVRDSTPHPCGRRREAQFSGSGGPRYGSRHYYRGICGI